MLTLLHTRPMLLHTRPTHMSLQLVVRSLVHITSVPASLSQRFQGLAENHLFGSPSGTVLQLPLTLTRPLVVFRSSATCEPS